MVDSYITTRAIAVVVGSLTLEDSSFNLNTAGSYGGGVFIQSGANNSVMMLGSEFNLNSALFGAGVSIGASGSGNGAQTGYFNDIMFSGNSGSGAFYINGGQHDLIDISITGGNGYGMYVESGGLKLSREIIVDENTMDEVSTNVYLIGSVILNLSGSLSSTSHIGISIESNNRAVVESDGSYIINSRDYSKFFSDSGSCRKFDT